MRAIFNASRRRAFTLVELLVGIGIFALLLFLLLQILSGSSGAWKIGEASKERMQNARAITDFIALDLESALLPLNRPDTNNLQFVVNPPTVPADYRNRDAVFWQAPRATDTILGDVAILGYFVKWDTANPSNPRSHLCRLTANYGGQGSPPIVNPHFLLYSQPTNWINPAVIDALAPAGKGGNYAGLFAENVLGLWISTRDSAGTTITASGQPFDSRSGYADSMRGVLPACALPSSVEVSVALLDSRSAARVTPALQTVLAGYVNTSANAAAFVAAVQGDPALRALQPGLRSHVTRVTLKNAP